MKVTYRYWVVMLDLSDLPSAWFTISETHLDGIRYRSSVLKWLVMICYFMMVLGWRKRGRKIRIVWGSETELQCQ